MERCKVLDVPSVSFSYSIQFSSFCPKLGQETGKHGLALAAHTMRKSLTVALV
jgi:hypothetical protein